VSYSKIFNDTIEALRGLSATAEFLVNRLLSVVQFKLDYSAVLCTTMF